MLPRCRLLLAGFFVSLLTVNLFATATATLDAAGTRTSSGAIASALATSPTQTVYLRFTVNGLMTSGSVITKATLCLYRATGSSPLSITAANNSRANSDSALWWNSASSLDLYPPHRADSPILPNNTVNNGNWLEIDITDQYITGDGVYSFAITSSGANTYHGLNSANEPKIVIEDAITLDKANYAPIELLEQGQRIADRYHVTTSGAINTQSFFYKYGVVDVTKQPYGAKPDDGQDDRLAIQRAINDARLARAVVYLPKVNAGIYDVSDTIEMVQGAIERFSDTVTAVNPTELVNMIRHDQTAAAYSGTVTVTDYFLEKWTNARFFGNALMGKPGARATLRLMPNSPDFNVSADPLNAGALPKPVLKIWSRWDKLLDVNGDKIVDVADFDASASGINTNTNRSAVNYNQTVSNIDIDLNVAGNQGAVGITSGTAQGGTISDCTITATGAFAGLYGSAGPGGGIHNVQVTNGQYGLCVANPQDGQQLLLSACEFTGQTQKAIYWRGLGGLTLVGTNITHKGIEVAVGGAPGDGMLCLVDSKIDLSASASEKAVISNRGVYMNRVYVKNGNPVITPAPGFPPPTPTPTTNLLSSTGWILINEYAGGVMADQNPYDADTLLTPVPYYINGTKTTNATRVNSTNINITTGRNFHADHHWENTPWFEDANVLNVTVAYSAKGDGVTDDTAAIQNAINAASTTGKHVFLPKGDYRISKSLLLKGAVKLFGIHKNYTIIQSAYSDRSANSPGDFYGTALDAKPLVTTEVGASGMLSDLTLLQRMTDAGSYLLNWKGSPASIVKNVTFLRCPMTPSVPATADPIVLSESPMILIEGPLTGGRFYHFWGVASSQKENPPSPARQLKVSGTLQPLALYMANFEYAHNHPQVEIVNAKKVDIYQSKFEGNYRNLHIKNSQHIRVFGVGGNACPFPSDVWDFTNDPYAQYQWTNQNILIENSTDYLVAGQSYQPRNPAPDGYEAQEKLDPNYKALNDAVYRKSVGAKTDPAKYKRLKDDPPGPTPATVTTPGGEQFVLYKRDAPELLFP